MGLAASIPFAVLALIFLTSVVPIEVPSELHSSVPFVISVAVNKRTLPKSARPRGVEEDEPVEISFTMYVPADVPSDRHNSTPFVPLPLVAAK
jgi:hypothetical protein